MNRSEPLNNRDARPAGIRLPAGRRRAAAGLVALGMALFVGCDGGTTEGATSTTADSSGSTTAESTPDGTVPAGDGPDCSLAPKEFVSEHIGIELKGPLRSGSGRFSICTYNTTADTPALGLRFQFPAARADFTKEKDGFIAAGATVADIPGLGDVAFSSVYRAEQTATTTNSVGVQAGDVGIIVSSPTASIDDLRSLIEAILAKL